MRSRQASDRLGRREARRRPRPGGVPGYGPCPDTAFRTALADRCETVSANAGGLSRGEAEIAPRGESSDPVGLDVLQAGEAALSLSRLVARRPWRSTGLVSRRTVHNATCLGLGSGPSIGRFSAILQVQTGPVQVIVAVLYRSSIALQVFWEMPAHVLVSEAQAWRLGFLDVVSAIEDKDIKLDEIRPTPGRSIVQKSKSQKTYQSPM